MRKIIFYTLALWSLSLSGQPGNETLSFKGKLQPLTDENIFKTEGYYNWCSSVKKGDESYIVFIPVI